MLNVDRIAQAIVSGSGADPEELVVSRLGEHTDVVQVWETKRAAAQAVADEVASQINHDALINGVALGLVRDGHADSAMEALKMARASIRGLSSLLKGRGERRNECTNTVDGA